MNQSGKSLLTVGHQLPWPFRNPCQSPPSAFPVRSHSRCLYEFRTRSRRNTARTLKSKCARTDSLCTEVCRLWVMLSDVTGVLSAVRYHDITRPLISERGDGLQETKTDLSRAPEARYFHQSWRQMPPHKTIICKSLCESVMRGTLFGSQ
jgi:hypothetical protein